MIGGSRPLRARFSHLELYLIDWVHNIPRSFLKVFSSIEDLALPMDIEPSGCGKEPGNRDLLSQLPSVTLI